MVEDDVPRLRGFHRVPSTHCRLCRRISRSIRESGRELLHGKFEEGPDESAAVHSPDPLFRLFNLTAIPIGARLAFGISVIELSKAGRAAQHVYTLR